MDGDIAFGDIGDSMRRFVLASLAVLLLAPPVPAASSTRGTPPRTTRKAQTEPRRAKARTAAKPVRRVRFAEARAAMIALQRDKTKRRYRHHWERAIGALVSSARGKDAAPALLEAARARYALYRWSANEADRDAALALTGRASKAGSRDARSFAAAIRREAGDDRPAKPTRQRAPGRTAPAPAPADEDSPPDPTLEAAVAEFADGATPPALALGQTDGAGAARVSTVRTWSNDGYTRVAIYLSHWVGWNRLELPADGELPRRLALDFQPAVLDGGAKARAVSGVQVDRVRSAQNAPETVRVVLDLPDGRADEVQVFGLEDPPRLIVDVGSHRETAPAVATAAPSRPTATPTVSPAAPATRAPSSDEEDAGPIRRIVVDAGHGGHDPGAIGPTRVREKDVTLAIAKRVAKRLRAEGFEVVLTRDRDRYLALEERTAIANTARGDLFVSIHANAHPRRNREGVETYFLNVADDRYAARLAARENGMELGDGGSGPQVQRILADLDAKASAVSSRKLASLVQREVLASVRSRVGEVRDLGVKGALFYVLLGARMPAVLVETAFISNRTEERRLKSTRYQDEVASAITRAVVGFAKRDSRVAAAR
jgi:N-acetylmuramoyl-L-alanine amidase